MHIDTRRIACQHLIVKKKTHPHKLISVRVPPDLERALDGALEKLRSERPGEALSMSDAIRVVLGRALLTK